VHAIVPFGAFVELGGTTLEVGQPVEVVVLAVDDARERFSLRPSRW
jgi:predicted RNA-binding protein with RPS1 domain